MVETSAIGSIAIVGLGKIGGNLARQALEKGIGVAGYTRGGPADDLVRSGLVALGGLEEIATALQPPRRVFLYIPAGAAVDETLESLLDILSEGDVVIDGGNSYWGDSIRRHERAAARQIRFVDLGTSGGFDGARHGACFMAGGTAEAFAAIAPILKLLSVPGGCVHTGGAGSGHFTKLVHNGIEFGMLEAIGEGIDLLDTYHDKLPIADILECWTHGSVIRSWLIELIAAAYPGTGALRDIPSWVEDTGEVNWLIQDAVTMERAIPIIAQSVMQLFASRDERRIGARAIAAMRHGFGGHPFGPDEAIRRSRPASRVGPLWRPPRG